MSSIIDEIVKEVIRSTLSRTEIGILQSSIYRTLSKGKNVDILNYNVQHLLECEKLNKLAFMSLTNWRALSPQVRKEFKSQISNFIKLDYLYLSIDEIFKNDYSLFKSLNPDLIVFIVAFDKSFEIVVTKSNLKSIKGIVSNRFKGKGNFNYQKIVARYQVMEGKLNVFKLPKV